MFFCYNKYIRIVNELRKEFIGKIFISNDFIDYADK